MKLGSRNKDKTPGIRVMKHIDTPALAWCGAAALVSVENGAGALRQAAVERANGDNDYMAGMALLLNGQPLVLGSMPGCSTSDSLLAAGYGIENADCAELKAVGKNLNEGARDIDAAVEMLSPLLGLLEDGLYVVADVPHSPTDGSGRFFWDVPPELTAYPATAMACSYDYQYTQGTPSFLYPSQSAARYDEARVRHYMERYGQGAKPRAVAYHLSEFLSVLLDGHHKAAASALAGQAVPCLTIIPLTSIVFEPPYTPKRQVVQELAFSGIRVGSADIPLEWKKRVSGSFSSKAQRVRLSSVPRPAPRVWEPEYAAAAKRYPTVAEAGESAALGLDEITDGEIAARLADMNDDNARWLSAAVAVLARAGDPRMKTLALACAKRKDHARKAAFRALAKLKGDADVEQLFISHLVEDGDPHSVLRKIAEDYFAE